MGVLADYLKTEADELRKEATRHQQNLQEWLEAIDRLYEQLGKWLIEADNNLGLISFNFKATTEFISEPRLGNYEVNLMWVRLGAGGVRAATVVPRARYVAATIHPPGREPRRADGMAQIKQGSTAEYYLFRWKGEGGADEWFIQSVNAWNATPGDYTVEPLNRDSFEAAILSVLQ